MAGAYEGVVVDAEQRRESGSLLKRDAALVAGHTIRHVSGVAAEVEEDERLAVYGEVSAFAVHLALVEIPVGGIEAGMSYLLYTIEIAGNKIEPFLVYKQSIGGIVVALRDHFGIEPAQDGTGILIILHSIKTCVVDAGAEQVAVTWQLAVRGKKMGRMRCDKKRGGLQFLLHQLQRVKDHDIRIEIDEAFRFVCLQQVCGKEGFHGAAQLEHIVAFRHLLKLGKANGMRFHNGVRGKALRVEAAVDPVHQSYKTLIARIVPQHRIAHIFSRTQVAGGTGGEHDCIHKHLSSVSSIPPGRRLTLYLCDGKFQKEILLVKSNA